MSSVGQDASQLAQDALAKVQQLEQRVSQLEQELEVKVRQFVDQHLASGSSDQPTPQQ